MDYPITGYAQTHSFDVRLNGTDEVLARTVSAVSSSVVQREVERAIYAFTDVRNTERKFDAIIIYDDTESARESAWGNRQFGILEKYDVGVWAFARHKRELIELAQEHLL